MSSDLQRFLRAVKTLEKLAHQYSHDAFLEALGRYATVQQEDAVWFVGTFLDNIGMELSHRRVDPEPRCRQCGKEIMTTFQLTARLLNESADTLRADAGVDERNVRADALYCSPACRQKAYRSRVTASTEKRAGERNDVTAKTETRERAVTPEVEPATACPQESVA